MMTKIRRSKHTQAESRKRLNMPLKIGENPNQIVGEIGAGVVVDDGKIRIINMGDREYDMYIFSQGWTTGEGWRAVKTYHPSELVDLAIAILEGVPDEEYIISKRVTVEYEEPITLKEKIVDIE